MTKKDSLCNSAKIQQPFTAVIIHGMWSNSATMSELEKSISSVVSKVVTLTLPNHQQTGALTYAQKKELSKLSLTDYTNHCLLEMDSIKGPIVLIGHSMGGLIAQLIAQQRELKGMILLSSAAPAGINAWSISMIRTLGKNLLKLPLWMHVTQLNLSNIRYGIANSQPFNLQQKIANECCLESGRASWQIAMWFLYLIPKNQVDESKVNCPVLIVAGEQDRITPIDTQRKLHIKYAKSELLLINNICHWTIGGRARTSVFPALKHWITQLPLSKP